jgi:hypothetical protein
MANEEHVALLRKGADVWNKWREGDPDFRLRRPDLHDLREADPDLIGANLIGANLSEGTSSRRTSARRTSSGRTSVRRKSPWRASGGHASWGQS